MYNRCKLVCCGLQGGLATARSKSYGTVVPAWFALHWD